MTTLHPQPGSKRPGIPEWAAHLLDLGETAKDQAREALHASIESGTFSPAAAETLIKSLWCRAFATDPANKRNPDWRTYGRMLLADPDLGAFYSHPKDAATDWRIRAGVEALCYGGPLPGLKAGYTSVFEKPAKGGARVARPKKAKTGTPGRTVAVKDAPGALQGERFIGASPRPANSPRYPARATFLKPEEQAEFGVETAHELVTMLNAAWANVGRRAVALGSYPTNRILLRTILREARLAKDEGHLRR